MELKDIIMIILNFISIVISIFALYKSWKANKKHNELLKQINGTEFQLNEKLKEMAIQIIAVIRSVDAKAAMALKYEKLPNKEEYNIDYSYEMNLLSNILSSPAYILFLKSIEDDEKRGYMESYLHNLVLKLSSKIEVEDLEKIRNLSRLILQQINYYKVARHIKDTELNKFIGELSVMKGIMTTEY